MQKKDIKKAVLSNRIFMAYEKELYEKCKLNLTYIIPSMIPNTKPYTKTTLKMIGENFISIPIGRQDLIPEDYKIVDKRIKVETKFPKFKYELYESQKEVYDAVNESCLINANTAWGKTFTAIAIAKKLQQKTLIIVHTVNLRDQWKREIKKTLGFTPSIIGSGNFEFDKPITVANIQTLRKHTVKLRNEFGTIILDECHHAPARIFDETLNSFRARYKIGLSATLKRKDYLHVVLKDFFSNIIHKPPVERQMKPKVMMVKSGIPLSGNIYVPWALRVNELVARPEYGDLIVTLAETYEKLGHKVLVIGNRINFLLGCHEIHKNSVVVYSKTKNRDEIHKELEENDEVNTLYGEFSIYKEGISLDFLSCLIIAVPINNDPLLEQLIGRILREYLGKLQPVIVDIVLSGGTGRRQAFRRAVFYKEKEYLVETIEA